MLGKERALQQVEAVMRQIEADGAEVTLKRTDAALTRYANSGIHQNVSHEDLCLSLRVVVGDKEGYAQSNQLDDDSLKQAVAMARKQATANQGAGEVLMAEAGSYATTPTFFASTLAFGAKERAQAVVAICQQAKREGFGAAGAVETSVVETAMINSRGLEAYQCVSEADMMAIVSGAQGSGYARACHRQANQLSADAIGQEAALRCHLNQEPSAVDSGTYPVVLAPYATGDLVMMLAAMALGAQEVQQGSSFMANSVGQQVLCSRFSLWDDGLDAAGLPVLFDREGVAKRRVDLICQGRPVQPVHDLTTAHKQKVASTGHASARGAGSPYAANLFMAPGEGDLDALVTKLGDGILITRFHYLAMMHPGQTRWSGMTRDGTFRVEGGKITKALRNVRFDDRITSQLRGPLVVGADARVVKGFGGCAHVPSVLLGEFNITGSTL